MGNLFDAGAFALGMVALINPCGFALLPAYLGFFLGLDDGDEAEKSSIIALNRAQVVGLSMSAGFLAVFGVLGVLLAGTLSSLQSSVWLPRITVAIGVGLIALGIAMLAGFEPMVKIPKLNKGGGSRSIGSMFLFGVSYAIASLACTIGIFLGALGVSATTTIVGLDGTLIEPPTFFERLGSFISYAIGMGLLATVLTLAVGFGKKGIVSRFRQVLPLINRISAVILVFVGFYVTLHGIWTEQILFSAGEPTQWINSITTTGDRWQANLANWINARVSIFGWVVARTTLMGWGFLIINVLIAGAGFVVRRGQTSPRQPALADS